jgi:hypothetical protein
LAEGRKVKEINLGPDFGDIAVEVNGVRVEVHADGSVDAYTDRAVNAHSAARNDKATASPNFDPKIGEQMPDGTVFAGISPDTGKAIYAMPADAPLTYKFKQALKYAAQLDAHGHKDWRVPTKGELTVLYNNREVIRGFNISGLHPGSWYWSSTENDDGDEWSRRFSDGSLGYGPRWFYVAALRCVR